MGSSILNLCSSYKQHMIPLALLALSVVQLCSSLPYYSRDGPLGMEELNMLHADAVKFGAASENVWFKAIDAATLDSLITEMNEMNRWFAKVVKYWDDFTSGGDGSNVLAENGPGIQKMPKNAEGAEDKDAAADGADASGDDTKAAESETDAAAADAEAPGEGEPPAGDDGAEEAPKGDEEEAPADGDKAADKEAEGDAAAGEEEAPEGEAPAGEEPAEGDAAAADDKAAAADPPAETEGEGKEEPPAARRKRMRRMRRRQR